VEVFPFTVINNDGLANSLLITKRHYSNQGIPNKRVRNHGIRESSFESEKPVTNEDLTCIRRGYVNQE